MALIDWAQLSVSVALVIATFGYAYFVKKSLEAETKPYLKPFLDYAGRGHLYFRVRNTGNGAAHSVDANWVISTPEVESEQRDWSHELVPPGHEHQFRVPFGPVGEGKTDVKQIREIIQASDGELDECTVQFRAQCENMLERRFHFNEKINVTKALPRADDAEVVDEQETVESIDTEIALIRSYLEDMK
jgi:hypothetical protein